MESLDALELLERMSVALGIGLLIGLERGWKQRMERPGERAAGLRTHALSALLGAVWGAMASRLSSSGGAVALGIAFSVFAIAIVVFRLRESIHDKTYGATTVVAAMLAFAIGAYALIGDIRVAAAAGVTTAALLAIKELLHTFVERVTWAELRSALVLLSMTFVTLPFLPNRTIDPWAAVNPHEIWLLTILIAAISFAGYIAIKFAGERRGIVITGIAGGLASSTAVTVTLSRMAGDNPGQRHLLLGGVYFANATMFARMLALIAAINAELLQRIGPMLGVAGLVYVAAGLLAMRQGSDVGETKPIALVNPFDLITVLKFGALLAAILLLAKTVTDAAGSAGAYLLAAVSGLADVDAITLAMARGAPAQLGGETAGIAIMIAAAVNSMSKSALSWFAGGVGVGSRMLIVAMLAIFAALGSIAIAHGSWL